MRFRCILGFFTPLLDTPVKGNGADGYRNQNNKRPRVSPMGIVKRTLSYVEIKTKITSVFPFLMGLAYLHSSGYGIDPLKTVVFFLGMFCFDLTATTVNNYYDTKKNHQTLQFARPTAMAILLILFAVSVFFGLFLVYLSDPVVLLLGVLCFFFGIIYSYGPVPISHGPYGEIVSGFFYGLIDPGYPDIYKYSRRRTLFVFS